MSQAETRNFTLRETVLGDHVIRTVNYFFRDSNASNARLASTIAPAYLKEYGKDEFVLADIGCSRAEDTWSTAAAFAVNGVKARITALDINTEVLACVDRPYHSTFADLEADLYEWNLPRECLDLFEEVDEYHIRPGPELRGMVTFGVHDIREQPLPPGFDGAIVNSFFFYYLRQPYRRHLAPIIGNIAAGLTPGGLVVAGGYGPVPVCAFLDAGFEVAEDWNPQPSTPNFFIYQPAQVAK